MNRYLGWFLCVSSFLIIAYYFVATFWMNNMPVADIPAQEYGYIGFWIAVFLLALFSIRKKKVRAEKVPGTTDQTITPKKI